MCVLVGAGPLPSQPVVQSYARAARAPAEWTVAPGPLLEIGGSGGSGSFEFSGIVGVTRQSDGAVVVADGTSRELRIFDSRGRHVRTATRRGQGPGELSDLTRFTAVGDTLVAIDGRRAVHVFAPNGTWLRSLVLPAVRGFIVNPVIGALNGTDMVLNLTAGHIDSVGSARRDSIWLGRVSISDTSMRILGAQPLSPNYSIAPGLPATYSLIFAPRTLTAIRAARMCLGYPVRYEITCVDSAGRPLLVIRRDLPTRAVHDSAKRAYRLRARAAISRLHGSLRAHRERVVAAAQFAETFPAYSQLLLARTGELWVRAYATEDGFSATALRSNSVPSEWSIFDSNGRWIADCRLPSRFAPSEIGADYVIGVTRDQDDVESVTLLRLRR